MDIELHGNELDDARRGQVHFGKRTMQQAEEQQIEREPEPVGCPAAGPHLSHILRGQEEKPGEVLRRPVLLQGPESPSVEGLCCHNRSPLHRFR